MNNTEEQNENLFVLIWISLSICQYFALKIVNDDHNDISFNAQLKINSKKRSPRASWTPIQLYCFHGNNYFNYEKIGDSLTSVSVIVNTCNSNIQTYRTYPYGRRVEWLWCPLSFLKPLKLWVEQTSRLG